MRDLDSKLRSLIDLGNRVRQAAEHGRLQDVNEFLRARAELITDIRPLMTSQASPHSQRIYRELLSVDQQALGALTECRQRLAEELRLIAGAKVALASYRSPRRRRGGIFETRL